MVARLKLKEIDGRAPPGVNNACGPQLCSLGSPRYGVGLGGCPDPASNNSSVCLTTGNMLKVREGLIGNPQPAPKPTGERSMVQRLDERGQRPPSKVSFV